MLDDLAFFYRRIQVDGAYLEKLYPGWKETAFFSLSDNIHAIVFEETGTGKNAIWFLNSRYAFCGSHVEFLNNLQTEDVLETVGYTFKRLYRTSLSQSPSASGTPLEFAKMPEPLALHLSLAWSARNIGNVTVCAPTEISAHLATLQTSETVPEPAALTRLLDTRRAPGPLVLLSPFTSLPLRSHLSFLIDGLIVHRFCDTEDGHPFYLFWARNKPKSEPSLYFPNSGLIVSDLKFPALIPAKILAWYLCNPDHTRMIEFALQAELETHGLGHASSFTALGVTPEGEIAPGATPQKADLISPAWAFLNKASPDNDQLAQNGEQKHATSSDGAAMDQPLIKRWFRKFTKAS